MDLTQEIVDSQKRELASKSKVPTATASETTVFSIDSVSQNQINFSFRTIRGNKPGANGNYAAIWQNSGSSIPWDLPPLKTKKVTKETPSGDMFFDELNLDKYSYVMGYAVGAELKGEAQQKYGNICSTAFVPETGGEEEPPFWPSVKVAFIGGNSVSVDYKLPDGILPKTNGAWIGIWESENVSYTRQPDAANTINLDKSRGSAFINGYTIGRDGTYTIGVFMSGWVGAGKPNVLTTLACSVTFTNS